MLDFKLSTENKNELARSTNIYNALSNIYMKPEPVKQNFRRGQYNPIFKNKSNPHTLMLDTTYQRQHFQPTLNYFEVDKNLNQIDSNCRKTSPPVGKAWRKQYRKKDLTEFNTVKDRIIVDWK